jgi:hypothetical protein
MTDHKICIKCIEEWYRLAPCGLDDLFFKNIESIKQHPTLAKELMKRFSMVWEKHHIKPMGTEYRGITGAYLNNWMQLVLKDNNLSFEISIFRLPVQLAKENKPKRYLVIIENLTQPYSAFNFCFDELLNSEYIADELIYRSMPDSYGEHLSKIYEKLWEDFAIPTLKKYLLLEEFATISAERRFNL